ncbi:MAG: TonB-dependent receptor, partial [Archangium sp.]
LGLLAERARRSGNDVLPLAPGVLLQQHGGEGHAPQIYVRGIDAGEGKDLELRVGGVSLNEVSHAHSHGYGDTYFIIPELVRAVRVTEGPFHASQGDFAVAGTIDFELGLVKRGVTAALEYGQFNNLRVTLLWGPGPRDSSFVGATFRQGSGFGPNRAFVNGAAWAQHEFRLPNDVRIKAFAAMSFGQFDQAGVLRLDDVQRGRDFFSTYDSNQGGAQQRHLVSLESTQKLDDGAWAKEQLFTVIRDQRLRENYTGYLLDVPPIGSPQRGDGVELAYGGVTVGARAEYHRALVKPADDVAEAPRAGSENGPPTLSLGFYGRYDDVESASRRLRAEGGAPYSTMFDNHLRVTNLAAWASVRAVIASRVVVQGGLRLDAFLFSVDDRNRPLVDRQGERLGSERIEAVGVMPSPRVSVDVRLVDGLSWMTAFGLGARSSDGAALSQGELAPFALVVSAESGFRYVKRGEVSLEARASAFATRVERDLVFEPTTGRNQALGTSNRAGVFGMARVTWLRWLDVNATVSYTRGHLPPAGTPWYELFTGPALPYVPRWLGHIEAVGQYELSLWSQRFTLTGGAALSAIGSRPLPLERFAEPVALLDLNARVRWNFLELGFMVDNVFDVRWRQAEYNYASNFTDPTAAPSQLATRHFAAGPPRMWRLSLAVTLD